MPILPNARPGVPLKIMQRPIDFSFWPMRRSTRRYGLQSRIFATDPWSVIRNSIDKRCPAAAKIQAHAFREQAEDYFRASQVAGLFTTKPLLLYYCFLNLAKSYILTTGGRTQYQAAYHGLSERLSSGGRELLDSYLEANPSTSGRTNIFDDFFSSLKGTGLSGTVRFELNHLLPQLLQGHRLWCTASGALERFVSIFRIDLLKNSSFKQIWLALNFFEDDLTRLAISRKLLLEGSGLDANYREVKSEEKINERGIIKFEATSFLEYNQRPSDKVPELVATLKHHIWTNVLSVPPYRKYYVYVSPKVERPFLLPQLLSIYAVFYYLGSVTRYKPEKFTAVASGEYGAQLQELVTNLPNQFLFLMASEFARQEVSRAAIV